MPSRPACALILLCWAYAAAVLFRRDILPDFWTSPPPDLRTVAVAEEFAGSTDWDLSVVEDSEARNLRSVGHATTESKRTPDGGTRLLGTVSFDSGNLLRGTPFATKGDDPRRDDHIEVANDCLIDPSGNLKSFRATVRSVGEVGDLLTLDGRVEGRQIVVEAKGPGGLMNWTRSFPYEPRGLIQNAVGPVDRLPGLQVGQRWETRVVNPLTGWVESVKTEVTGKHAIQWDNNVVTTLEVVQHLSTFKARTWVRRDGLVLRQEVPFPFVKLILERLPDRLRRGQVGAQSP